MNVVRVLCILALPVIAACGDRGDAARDLASVEPFAAEVVRLAEAEDYAALEALIGYTDMPCSAEKQPTGPRCAAGEAPGTIVPAFRVGVCHFAWLRSDDPAPRIQPRGGLSADFEFYAIVKDRVPGDLPADYQVLFRHLRADTGGSGFWYSVRGQRIVGAHRVCGSITNTFGENPNYLVQPTVEAS